jgi:hypothetical protein
VLVNIKETYCSKLGRFNVGLIGNKEYGLFYLLELGMYYQNIHATPMKFICPQTNQM